LIRVMVEDLPNGIVIWVFTQPRPIAACHALEKRTFASRLGPSTSLALRVRTIPHRGVRSLRGEHPGHRRIAVARHVLRMRARADALQVGRHADERREHVASEHLGR
jgi:hypothetical protein